MATYYTGMLNDTTSISMIFNRSQSVLLLPSSVFIPSSHPVLLSSLVLHLLYSSYFCFLSPLQLLLFTKFYLTTMLFNLSLRVKNIPLDLVRVPPSFLIKSTFLQLIYSDSYIKWQSWHFFFLSYKCRRGLWLLLISHLSLCLQDPHTPPWWVVPQLCCLTQHNI